MKRRYALDTFAMANLPARDTGVDGAVIWVAEGEFGGADSQHGPRVRVVPGTKITSEGLGDAVSITLTEPPRVLGTLPGRVRKLALEFVRKNREVLRRYWNNDLSTREMLDALVRAGKKAQEGRQR